MTMKYNRELWGALEQYHPRYYCDDRVLEYDILYRYLNDGEETVNKEDIPWIKTFFSEEEIICRMRAIELKMYEEMIYYKSSGNI